MKICIYAVGSGIVVFVVMIAMQYGFLWSAAGYIITTSIVTLVLFLRGLARSG